MHGGRCDVITFAVLTQRVCTLSSGLLWGILQRNTNSRGAAVTICGLSRLIITAPVTQLHWIFCRRIKWPSVRAESSGMQGGSGCPA